MFATVHNLMKDINMIDSCQAHLPVQFTLRTSNSFARSDTGAVIDLIGMCKTSLLLFAELAVSVHTGCSALHSNKTVTMITYQIQNCFAS